MIVLTKQPVAPKSAKTLLWLSKGTMKRAVVTILLCILMCSCHHGTSLSLEDRQTLERRTILDEAMERKDLREEWKLAQRDLPTDVWVVHPKIGRYNESRTEREIKLSDKMLAEIKPKIESMTATELLDSLKVLPPGSFGGNVPRVIYYVWRDGNEMVLEEFNRRPIRELEILRSHTNDLRIVFTDDSGEYLTVGGVVHRALGDTQW